MKAKMKMGWAVACGCIMVMAACSTYTITDINPPVLDQNQSELVEIRGNIDFGQTVTAQKYSETKPLTGWVFDANSGARVTAMLKSSNGETPMLVLYGPQDKKGAFGTAVEMDSAGAGELDAVLNNIALKNGGRFLIAVGTARGAQGGTFDLALGCAGNCEEPKCEDVSCDLYCENGYMIDPNGCFICRCAEGECQSDEECFNLYPWVQFARCVNGFCQFDLYCDENTPCPEGFYCVEDFCPDMPCTEDDCPPCAGHCERTNEGECDENNPCPPGFFCAMECWETQCDPDDANCSTDVCDPATGQCTGSGERTCVGRCVPETIECQDSSQCPEGQVCEITCWECDETIPPCGEPRPCQTDEDCMDAGMAGKCVNGLCDMGCQDCVPGCVGHCVPRQLECTNDAECPPGYYCAIECWEADCDTATGECPPCVDEDGNNVCDPVCKGVCLPYGQQFCNGDFDCIDSAGQQGRCINGVCVFGECNCPDVWEPVCASLCQEWCDPSGGCGGFCELRTFPNECYARCEGAEIVHLGTCEGEPTCWTDADCFSADGRMGRCINGQCVFDNFYCHADWECPPGERCDIFECIPGCWGDVWACCQGVCVQEAQCRTDEDCMVDCQPGTDCGGMQARCIEGRCVYDQCACPEVWDPVCAVKCYEQCDETDPNNPCAGACVEQTYSNACFAECDGARILHMGTCEEQPGQCRTDADCPPGTYCEFCILPDGSPGPCTDVGVCLPLPQMYCEQDADCPAGFRCELWCPPCASGDPNCAGCDAIGGQCVPVEGECVVSGCNGEICAAYPMESDCMWLPEYECLRLTTCGLQQENGVAFCGWAQTQEYLDCLANIQGGEVCQDDSQCAAGEYCQVSCSSDGVCRGVCVVAGCACPEYYDPVCGVDGQTYSNICFLSCANMELAYFGECR